MNNKTIAHILFKTRRKLRDHYKKHRDSTDADSVDDYLHKANKALQNGQMVPAKRGKIRFVVPETKEHVIYDPYQEKLLSYYVKKAIEDDNARNKI